MGTFRDISGQVINGITVLRLSGRRGPSGQYYYICRCHCGNEFEVMGGSLLSGHTKSCGCSRHEQRPNQYGPHGHFELVGKKVGELIVEKYNGYDAKIKQHLWDCRCSCGRTRIVSSRELNREHCKSCGQCGYSARKVRERLTKYHTEDEQRLKHIINAMKMRCHNPNDENYHRYGARGITVCDEWRGDPMVFVKWALANGYRKGLTLERVDNNKGYSPTNCSWKDRFAQANNTRSNHWIQISNDIRLSRAQCARLIDVSYEESRKFTDEQLAEKARFAIQHALPNKMQSSDIESLRAQVRILPIQSLSPTAEILRRIFG